MILKVNPFSGPSKKITAAAGDTVPDGPEMLLKGDPGLRLELGTHQLLDGPDPILNLRSTLAGDIQAAKARCSVLEGHVQRLKELLESRTENQPEKHISKELKDKRAELKKMKEGVLNDQRNLQDLTQPQWANFLENELGNLPLAVSLVGHLMRNDPQIKNAKAVIDLFEGKKEMTVTELGERGRNPRSDKVLF